MESNELKKNVASEETELLKNVENDEAPASVTALESTENESIKTTEEIDISSLTTEEPLSVPDNPVDSSTNETEVLSVAFEQVEERAELAAEPATEADIPEIINAETESSVNLDKIPKPVKEVAGATENALIDQIVQVPLEVDDDDDLFNDREPDSHAIPIHDYSSYSKVQLVNTLRKILSEGTVEEIRPHAEAIKGCFYKIRNSEVQEQKLAFTSAGNEEELFEPQEDEYEAELKDLLREYKKFACRTE